MANRSEAIEMGNIRRMGQIHTEFAKHRLLHEVTWMWTRRDHSTTIAQFLQTRRP
jgi:hypothetical protein